MTPKSFTFMPRDVTDLEARELEARKQCLYLKTFGCSQTQQTFLHCSCSQTPPSSDPKLLIQLRTTGTGQAPPAGAKGPRRTPSWTPRGRSFNSSLVMLLPVPSNFIAASTLVAMASNLLHLGLHPIGSKRIQRLGGVILLETHSQIHSRRRMVLLSD